jgi:DNA-binding IclR family transcriptional regulator
MMIKVILKCLKILEIVSASGNKPVKLSDLAQQLDEKPSTVAGIVKTMTEAGYLQKDPVRGYHLGIMAATLTHGDIYHRSLLIAAKNSIMQEAVDNSLTLSLNILRDNVRQTILEVGERGDVIMQARANAAVMNSATGLILVSHQERHKQDELIDYYGVPRRFAGYEDFMRYLDNIKKQGYAEIARPINRIAVAVPVWDKCTDRASDCQVVAGLGIFFTVEQRPSWPTDRAVRLLNIISGKITCDLIENADKA